MVTKVEKLRRVISWIVAVSFIVVVIFSRTPFERTFFYEIVEMMGFILIITATLGRIWCSLYIGGRKDTELCQDGPYSIVRNPLYVFSFFGVVGIICCAQNLTLLIVMIPIYWGYYYFIMRSEEKRLIRLFGHEFIKYCSKVNRVIPKFNHYWSRESININPHIVFKTIADASVFMWILVGMEVLENVKMGVPGGEGILPVLWQLPF